MLTSSDLRNGEWGIQNHDHSNKHEKDYPKAWDLLPSSNGVSHSLGKKVECHGGGADSKEQKSCV